MRTRALWMGSAIVMFTAGVAAGLVLANGAPVADDATPPSLALADDRFDEMLARLEDLDRRLTSRAADPRSAPPREVVVDTAPLDARLARIERALATSSPADPVDWDARFATLEERLTARIDEIGTAMPAAAPAEKFADLSDAALSARARLLASSKDPGELTEAAGAFEAFIARQITDVERRNAYRDLGSLLFDGKDYYGAAKAFGAAIEIAGRRSPDSLLLANSRGWSLGRDGDHRGAIEEFDYVLTHPGRTETVDASARSAIAMYAKLLGDTNRARDELQAIVTKYAGSEHAHLRRYATNAKERLGRL